MDFLPVTAEFVVVCFNVVSVVEVKVVSVAGPDVVSEAALEVVSVDLVVVSVASAVM